MKFDQPAWLILLVLLPLLGAGAIAVARLRRKQWSAFAAPRLRPVLVKRGSAIPRWFALFFLLTACAALIAGLARPQGDAGTRTEKSLGRNVLIALDLSRSMRVQDVKPDRLSRAKMVIYELLEAMPNEKIGLIGFAGSAYTYAPLTVDHAAVRETVEQIDEDWVPVGGSNLADAIKLATETLKKTGQRNNALVILSDGEKHEGDLDRMVKEAGLSGVYILAIGVGTEDGDYIPAPGFPGDRMVDHNGKPIISRLQPDVMRKLAAETKGRFAIAGSGMDIPAMLKSSIEDLDAFELEGRERRVSIEFYQWLVFPAIVFLTGSVLAATRWRGIKAAAVTAAVLLSAPAARADAVSSAKDALIHKNYAAAKDAYRELAQKAPTNERRSRFSLGEATAAYRGHEYKDARAAYSRALLSEDTGVLSNSHTGMGNTLFQLGWRGLTDESYPEKAEDAPDLARFDVLVKERLAKMTEEAEPAAGESGGYARMESLVTNWADAVRHFDSALKLVPSNKKALDNRQTAMIYLKRLQELLQQDKEQTEQAMPQPQPGEGKPHEGDGEPKEKSGDEGEKGPEKPGDKGENGEKEQDDKGGDQEKKPDDGSGKKKDEKDPDKGKAKADPDETPEERASRILKENADLEKGPLTPGRREFQPPAKDW